MDERVDFFDAVDNSEEKVRNDRADTFLLGGRRPRGDDEYDDPGRFVKTFRFLGEQCTDFSGVVPARDVGLLGVMKPYRSTSAPSTFSQSSSPPARSYSLRI